MTSEDENSLHQKREKLKSLPHKQRRAHDSMCVGEEVGAALRAGRGADGLAVLSIEGEGGDAADGREMPLMGAGCH